MYVCVFVCVCVCVCVCVHVYVFALVFVCAYVYSYSMFGCVNFVCACVCVHVRMYLKLSYCKILEFVKKFVTVIGASLSEPHHVGSTVKFVFLLACLILYCIWLKTI